MTDRSFASACLAKQDCPKNEAEIWLLEYGSVAAGPTTPEPRDRPKFRSYQSLHLAGLPMEQALQLLQLANDIMTDYSGEGDGSEVSSRDFV